MTGWLLFPAGVTAMAFVIAVAISLCIEPLVRAAARFEPASRARLLGFVALVPVLAATAIALMGFLPTVLFDFGIVPDLCLDRQASDHLSCPMHPRTVGIGSVALLLAMAAGVVAIGALAYATVQLLRARRVLARLDALSEPEHTGVVRVVRSACPLALSSTWPRERIYVSRSVLEILDDAELDGLILHERAHLERRDTMRLLVARLAAHTLLPRARRRLLQALELAVEQACDQVAARRVGPVAVASALLKFSRAAAMPGAMRAPLVSAYDGADIAHRVHALVAAGAGAVPAPRLRVTRWWVAALVPTCWLLHELGEFVLRPLVG